MINKIRVLVVDDSFLMRNIISDIINSDPSLEVVDKARDGKEALEKVLAVRPDVVTLDVNLPLLDGITVLEEIMRKQPTRVVMLSAYTREGTSATIRALELGAVDFIAKPSGEISLDLPKLKDEIISKIKIASTIDLGKFLSISKHPRVTLTYREEKPLALKKLVVIAASTGGPKAILEIMQDMPADMPAAFLIIQHIPQGFTSSFAERISWQSRIKTKEAEEGDVILPAKAFVAPAGYHLVLEKDKEQLKVRLNQEGLVNFVRPSADVTMTSVAQQFGNNAIGIILTGMGRDGLEGAREIRQKGGLIIVQDEATSVVWGMPKMIYGAGLADKILPLYEIPKAIIEEINRNV